MGLQTFTMVVFLSSVALAKGLDLLPCDTPDSECPSYSQCKTFDNRVQCLCNQGYQPSDDGKTCLKVVELDGDCSSEGTTCRRGPWGRAVCSAGRCVCPASLGYRRTTSGRCTKAPIKYGYALLGDECNRKTLCWDARTQQCITGRCTCSANFKMADDGMRFALPNIDECVASNVFIRPAFIGL